MSHKLAERPLQSTVLNTKFRVFLHHKMSRVVLAVKLYWKLAETMLVSMNQLLLKREKNHKKKTAVSHQLAVNLLLGTGFFSTKTHQIHLTLTSFDKKDTHLVSQTGVATKDQIFWEIFQCPL